MSILKYISKRVASFGYAFKGLWHLVSSQPNAQIHLFALASVTVAGLYVGLERWEWVAVILVSGLVIALEAVNTAIELLCDKLHPEQHPMIGKAKDVAAAAVLIAAMVAVGVAVLVFVF